MLEKKYIQYILNAKYPDYETVNKHFAAVCKEHNCSDGYPPHVLKETLRRLEKGLEPDFLAALENESNSKAELQSLKLERLEAFVRETEELHNMLWTLDKSELLKHYDAEMSLVEAREHQEREEEDKLALFNTAKAQARWNHWLAKPNWTLDEAAALSLERDPSVVNRASMMSVHLKNKSNFKRRFDEICDIIERASHGGEFADDGQPRDRVKPERFMKWAVEQEFVWSSHFIPLMKDYRETNAGAWKAEAEAASREAAELRTRVDHLVLENEKLIERCNILEIEASKTCSARERNNLLKIIISMACEKYHYKPNNPKNDSTTNILGGQERRLGKPISAETLLKRLREASQFLHDKASRYNGDLDVSNPN
jgi:hypothetical protein